MNRSTPGLPVRHQLPEFTQTHVHQVSDAIQPSHPLSSPSPPAPNPSQHQSLFQWVNSLQEVARVVEFLALWQVNKWKTSSYLIGKLIMYGCESWIVKKAEHQRTVVLEKTIESPLDCREIQPVYSKGDQSSVFIGRTDAKAETPILWLPDAKSWLIWKDPDAGKDWRQEEKGMTEDEMFGWHHWLWTWVWVNSRSWWWTGRPGMLQSMGLQRVGRYWATLLNWTTVLQMIHILVYRRKDNVI